MNYWRDRACKRFYWNLAVHPYENLRTNGEWVRDVPFVLSLVEAFLGFARKVIIEVHFSGKEFYSWQQS